MSISSIEDVFSTTTEQLQTKLQQGIISEQSLRYSEALASATRTLIAEANLDIGDAVVLMSLLSSVMAMAQGAQDLERNKDSHLAKHYVITGMQVMARVAEHSLNPEKAHRELDKRLGVPNTTPGSTDPSFSDFDGSVPPAGVLQ